MFFRLRSAAAIAVVGVALLAVGCGGGSASLFSPSSTGGAGSGAVISGTVTTSGGAFTTQSLNGGFSTLGSAPTVQVTVAGTGIGTTTDGQGHFTLTGVPSGDIKLLFSGPGVSGSITISGVTASEHIDIAVSLSGGGAHKDSEHRDHNGVDVNGRITSINASARTFQVGDKKVSVPTTATIRHGNTTFAFADLKVGDHVEVKGTQSGDTFVADEVKVEQDGEDDDATEAAVSGTISGLSGTTTCPAVTFTVGTTKVTTSSSTTFIGVTCSALANGTKVDVKGAKQTDGSIAASRVSLGI